MRTEIGRYKEYYIFKLFNDDEKEISHAAVKILTSRLNGAEVKSITVGGVFTDPEYRRLGAVRIIFNEINKFAEKEKCLVTFLHPFATEYYRKFGYERISNHCVLEFPMSALEFAPRYNNLKPYKDTKSAGDLVEIYNEYAKNRNIMIERMPESYPIPEDDKKIYILYDENDKPTAYIYYSEEYNFVINHNIGVNLNVYEMCFASLEDLIKLFGFIRMFEGNIGSVKIHDCAMSPEVELTLKHYEHMSISHYPDISARINNTQKVLSVVTYPEEKGKFIVKVTEPEKSEHSPENTAGIFKVEYQNKKSVVTKLDDNSDFDFSTDIQGLTKLIYGFNTYGYEISKYMRNTKFNNECPDFFRAFPNRPCGTYEHF